MLRYILVLLSFVFAHVAYPLADSITNSWTNKIIGEIGEGIMCSYFQYSGWEQLKIPTQNHLNGIDGVFVKRSPSGRIVDVVICESKVNTSQEGRLVTGERQGSKAYNLKKLNDGYRLADSSNLKQDISTVIKLVENDVARSIEQRLTLTAGRVFIEHRDLIPLKNNPNDFTKSPKIITADFSYENPTSNYEKVIVKNINTQPRKYLLGRGFSDSEINRISGKLNEEIGNGRDIWECIGEILKQIPDSRKIPDDLNKKSPLLKTYARTSSVSNIVKTKNVLSVSKETLQSSIKNASVAGSLVFAFESGDAVYRYANNDISTGELYERMQRGVVDGVVSTMSMSTIKPILGMILPDGRLLCATEAGMFVIAIEMGLVCVELWDGEIDIKEFNRKATESVVTGVTVSGAMYAAIYLGATPGGIVVLAVGTGAYLITDLAIKEYHRREWVHNTSVEELASFGIINRKNPFEIKNQDNPLNIDNPVNPLEMKNKDNSFAY